MSNIVQTAQQAVTIQAKSEVEYTPFGSEDRIKLSLSIVKNYIAVPTRDKELPDERDCMRFLMLCRSRRLDPFTGDAYMIGFKKQGADKAEWSLITSQSAFMKRAEIHPEFDGLESGVIVRDSEDRLVEREGDFLWNGDELLGGWATVHFKSRKFPMRKKVQLVTYRKNFGVWVTDPAGMICKVAEVHALRDSFPTMLGGMLLREEATDITAEIVQQTEVRRPEFARGLPAPDLKEQPGTQAGTVRTPKAAETKAATVPDIALSCPIIGLLSGDDYTRLRQLRESNSTLASEAQREVLLNRLQQASGETELSCAEPAAQSACFIRHKGGDIGITGEYRSTVEGLLGLQGVIAILFLRPAGDAVRQVSEASRGSDGVQNPNRESTIPTAQGKELRHPSSGDQSDGNPVPSAVSTVAAPSPARGEFKPKEGEGIPLTAVRRWLHDAGRTEGELLRVLVANKAAKPNQKLAELSEAKLDNVYKARSTLATQMSQQPIQ